MQQTNSRIQLSDIIGCELTSPSKGTWIIAEIGVNHEGDVGYCSEMIRAAASAGVDAVKLQTIDPDENYVKGTESYSIFSSAQLSNEETESIFYLAKSLGVEVFTTLGDLRTLNFIEALDPCAYKISSGLLTHLPLIRAIAQLNRPVLMSTGMAGKTEVHDAIKVVRETGNNQIGLFQCTSLYPAAPEMLNLAAIAEMRERWNLPVGFSDHSLGDDAVFLSIGAGATLIEKHFSLDPTRPGFDHGISLDQYGFEQLVRKVRLAEKMMTNNESKLKEVAKSREKFIRCLVAARSIKRGARFSTKDVAVKRPLPGQQGLAPSELEVVLGSSAIRDLELDEPINASDVAFK